MKGARDSTTDDEPPIALATGPDETAIGGRRSFELAFGKRRAEDELLLLPYVFPVEVFDLGEDSKIH